MGDPQPSEQKQHFAAAIMLSDMNASVSKLDMRMSKSVGSIPRGCAVTIKSLNEETVYNTWCYSDICLSDVSIVHQLLHKIEWQCTL